MKQIKLKFKMKNHYGESLCGELGNRKKSHSPIHPFTYLPVTLILFLSCALFLSASGCATPGEIQRVGVITALDITDNKLNIAVDKPFTYTVYESSDPYKIIVEIPDVRLGLFTEKIKSDKKGITEITPSQTEQPFSSRLEILLSSPVAVEPLYKETTLAIRVKEEPGAAEEIVTVAPKPKAEEKVIEVKAPAEKIEEPAKEVKWAEVAKPEEEVSVPKEFPPATSIVQVDIEKEESILKVVIKGNGSLSPNVFRLDSRAVLDIPNVTMAASLPPAVPLPLKNIRAGKHRDNTRLVFDMTERTNFDVTAVKDSVIVAFRLPEEYVAKVEKAPPVEVKAVVVEPEKPVEGKYKGQKISLDFQDADIGPIFRLLADISGYNFVIDPSVKGKITMRLMNVPWDQALDIILQTFGYGKRIEGNIIWIAPTSLFAKITEEQAKTKDIEEKAEDLITETIDINYATASEISTEITQAKLLSSRGSVTANTRMNSIIVRDTQKSIDRIKEYLKKNDRPKDQLIIEAKIVEVSSNYAEALGIRWGGSFYTRTWPNTLSGDFSVNTPIVSASPSAKNPGGALGLTLGFGNTLNVNLSLSALESIGKSRRLSNPKILTLDNKAATIQQGVSIPVSTVSAEGTKTEYVNATLSLAVTPRIVPNTEDIELQINATNNALGILTPQGYAIETKSVTTNARIRNGDTLVIGGIYTTSTAEGTEGIPLLSKIPIFGWLFKTKSQTGPNVTELLIFITPTIVSHQL